MTAQWESTKRLNQSYQDLTLLSAVSLVPGLDFTKWLPLEELRCNYFAFKNFIRLKIHW